MSCPFLLPRPRHFHRGHARNSATPVGRDRDEIRPDIAGVIANRLRDVITNLNVGGGQTALLAQLSRDAVQVGASLSQISCRDQ